MVCFVKHLVTWLKPCFLPHFLWREQLSLLPNATGCLRGHLSHRNNVYSSENISLARQVGIHQKYHSRHDIHAACLRHRYRRGLLLINSGNPEPFGREGNNALHLRPFSLRGLIKAYRIAEKLKDERGKEDAKLGLLFVVRGDWLT